MLCRISLVLVLALVAAVCANEMREKFCKIVLSDGGIAKMQECGKKAPKEAQDIPMECKKELGFEAMPLEEYSKKCCDPKETDLQEKLDDCNTKKFMALMEKDEDFIEKCQPFMDCLG